MSGKALERKVDKYTNQMLKNDVCSYIIYAPEKMAETDQLKVTIDEMENVDVYMAKGKGYKWINHLDQMVQNGQTFDTRTGWQFYIVGVGNSIFPGSFKIKTWVELGTADLSEQQKQVEEEAKLAEEQKRKEEELAK